jgi:TRAP-type transport system periplasmic protein
MSYRRLFYSSWLGIGSSVAITKASRATATRDLQALVAKGALTRTGELRHTRYHLNELYSALQTKIVDGQENPLTVIDAGKYYEVQKYCSITEHMWDGLWIIANGKRIKSLAPDDMALITKSFEAATAKQRTETERLNTELEGALKAKGLAFSHPDKKPFREALTKAGFYADWKQKYGAEAWATLEKYAGPLV